jgi:hypothetical protein
MATREVRVEGIRLRTTPVYDTYWQFAAERQRIFFRRKRGDLILTQDPILASFRFTNAYRAIDRVTQFLIRDVIANSDHTAGDVFFRTLLFKIFNKIETWRMLENELGQIHAGGFEWKRAETVLTSAMKSGISIYSAAYIMPSPGMGEKLKHSNHLRLLRALMADGTSDRWAEVKSLRGLYELLLTVASFGRFLAFQYAIDLNYSDAAPHEEDTFVVAGPGALSGISKCFENADQVTPELVIAAVAERQEIEFARLGCTFPSLYGRRLKLIDCQNLFCEVDKYARVAHPQITGVSGRSRIKQTFKPRLAAIGPLEFPQSWNLSTLSSYEDAVASVFST